MAANNRGNMRPTNRSPPFLAIGLFVALVILGFNYWNLSVKNGEQYNEISVMERELKLVTAKKTAIEKRAEAIQDKVKYLEDELSKQKGVVGEKASALATAQNERDTIAQAKDELKTEYNLLREKVPLCEKEVEELKQAVKIAKDELEQKQNQPTQTQTCGESECASFISSSRDKTLEDIIKASGSAPVVSLFKNGGNVGKFAETVKSFLENQGQQQALQPAPQQNQPIVGQPIDNAGAQQVQPVQPVQPDANVVVNQQQPAVDAVKQEIPNAQDANQPGAQPAVNSPVEQPAVNAAEQPAVNAADQPAVNPAEQPAVNPAEQPVVNNVAGNEQPLGAQAQVPAPIVGDVKPAEAGDAVKHDPALSSTSTVTQSLTTQSTSNNSSSSTMAPQELKPGTSTIETSLSSLISKTLFNATENKGGEAKPQDDNQLDADKKLEADDAEGLDDEDDNAEGAVLEDKKIEDIKPGDLDKVDANEDDYDDEDDADAAVDAVADRMKLEENDKDEDNYDYQDDQRDPKDGADNLNDDDYDDADDNADANDNYGDANSPLKKEDGVEEMKIEMDKDKQI